MWKSVKVNLTHFFLPLSHLPVSVSEDNLWSSYSASEVSLKGTSVWFVAGVDGISYSFLPIYALPWQSEDLNQ